MTPTVRAERISDHPSIDKVNRRAFGQPNEASLVASIRDLDGFDASLSLVAECDGRVVGHLLLSRIHIEAAGGDVRALALAPMAVLPEYQRRGVGSDLVRAGIEAARGGGHHIIVVLGHPAYYPRFGFVPARRFGIESPFSVPDEVFMVMALTDGALIAAAGLVRYPDVFLSV